MPRKRLDDDLSKFYDWMIACGFSPSTAKVYTSSCRTVARKLGDGVSDPETLQAHFEEVKADHPKVHATYVSAHNCLNRYKELDGRVPEPEEVKQARVAEQKKKYPTTVQLAIKVIENYNKKAEFKVGLEY